MCSVPGGLARFYNIPIYAGSKYYLIRVILKWYLKLRPIYDRNWIRFSEKSILVPFNTMSWASLTTDEFLTSTMINIINLNMKEKYFRESRLKWSSPFQNHKALHYRSHGYNLGKFFSGVYILIAIIIVLNEFDVAIFSVINGSQGNLFRYQGKLKPGRSNLKLEGFW